MDSSQGLEDRIAKIKGYIVPGGEKYTNGISMRDYWSVFALEEFKRISERHEIPYDTVKCVDICITGNFTVITFRLTIEDRFDGYVYGVSKRMPEDIPSVDVGISVAISNLVGALTGKKVGYNELEQH